MRLIDAELLLKSIEVTPQFDCVAELLEMYIKLFPTAYNVDKVVEQLEHLLNNFGEHCEDWGSDKERDCHCKSCSDCVLKHAIEIVKAGGAE